MPYNRPPRIQTPLPNDIVKIPEPPDIPSKPDNASWLTVVLPVGAVLISIVLMVTLMDNSSSALNYLLFIPIMLVSYLAAILTTSSQKKNYEKKLTEGRTKFRSMLRDVEERLADLHKREHKLRLSLDPDPGECIFRAQQSDPRLGERRPEDPDFLHVRLGVGNTPVSYRVETISEGEIEEFPKELEFINQLVAEYTVLKEVPIQARFPLVGSVGVAGARTEVLGLTRTILGHLMVHHWPAEVKVAAVCKVADDADWQWLQRVPHTLQLSKKGKVDGKTVNTEPDSRLMAALEAELQRREQQVESQKLVKKDDRQGKSTIPLPRLVVVFDYLPVTYRHPALNLLHKKGRELGVHGVFLTENPTQVPGDCGAVINISGGRLTYSESGTAGYKQECVADTMGMPQVEMLAHALTDIDWAVGEDASLPPETITFLQLFGVGRVEDLPIETWWEERPPHGFLRAPIGRISSTSDMIFDLNDRDGAHGPHGLLGGMTGSGKSEVLKAIILALAVTHHPYDLNFALIDFKGGAAFNELSQLPHTVGVVTDIESNATFAERVIQALSGEIERRKRVLEDARAVFRFGRSHIDEYRGLRVRRPLPRLVIVFDEFAEFKQRNPVESKKLISIARQGRSLGVHLILATQNIDAAVDPEILQNSSFRICLKVSEPQDSVQMVGIPDAVNLTRGRAYFASNTRILYQSAFSGAHYSPHTEPEEIHSVVRIWPDGRREALDVPRWGSAHRKDVPPSTEASAVVERISAVARNLNLKKPPAVWPDALPDRLYLPDLLNKQLTGGWDGREWHLCRKWGAAVERAGPVFPVLGLSDLPARQVQTPFQLDPGQGGHLLVFGSAGSGKSTLLRTLVSSLALTQSPAEAQVYILDFGGQSALKLLEAFPHVGAVVNRLEIERAERLVQLIQAEVGRRNELLRSVRVDSWLDYNALAPVEERLPALYLIIDDFRNFKQAFESEFTEIVTGLISGGQAAGLFLVAAASLETEIPNDLFANINQRLTFNQADSTEYFRIVGQPSEAKLLEDAAKGVRPGRGLLRGTPPTEFQAALPTYGESDKEQAANLVALAEQMRSAWKGKLPAPVRTLPLLVTLPGASEQEPNAEKPYFSMLGVDFEGLAPIGFSLLEDGPVFLVGGSVGQSGKTSLLHTWLLSLSTICSPEQLQVTIIDFHSRSLAGLRRLPIVRTYVGNRAALEQTLTSLSNESERRKVEVEKAYEADPDHFDLSALLGNWPHLLLVIDDYERFYQSNGMELPQLTECLQSGGELGCSFIIAGNTNDLPNSYSDHFMERFRKQGCGVLLGGIEGIDEFNNTRRPIGSHGSGLPPGRGYWIKRGRAKLFQAAAYWQEDQEPSEALQERFKVAKII